MSRARFLATLAVQVPWTAAQLLVEALLLASVARRPARAGERPWAERYERIGPGWLTGILRDGGALDGGEVVAVELERFGTVGQMSAVFRLRPTYGPGAAGPERLVLKTTAPEMKQRVLNAALGVFAEELRCYRLPRPERGLLRPHCWYAAQHRLTRAAILVIDDLSAWRGAPADGQLAVEDATRVVLALAEHHATWWQDPGLRARGFKTTSKMVCDTFGPMCALAWPRARKLMTPLVDADTLALLGGYVTHHEAIGRRIMAGPVTLVHGDLNPNNLFLDDAGGAVYAIDWQAAHIGHWAEDLAYLAVMSMDAEVWAAHEDAMIAAHRGVLVDRGIAVDEARHRADYALGLFQVGAILILAALILDPRKNPPLYEQYRERIRGWAIAARRHRLPALLAEVQR
ncbi:MAG TPA: phosphotransferase [Nannocystis sp.]